LKFLLDVGEKFGITIIKQFRGFREVNFIIQIMALKCDVGLL